MNKLTEAMVKHGYAVACEMNATALMFDADALESSDELTALLGSIESRVVLISRDKDASNVPESDKVTILNVPKVPMTRMGQIKIAVLLGVAEKKFERNDLIVCLTGVQHTDRLDLMALVKVGDEPEFFLTDEAHPVPPDVQPPVFERVLSLVSQLAVEGREDRQIGCLMVVGDSDNVLENSRQLIFNPFHGYPEEERNILSGNLDETIKEFSAIDGAFIIRGDGVVLAAGRYLMPKGKAAEPLRAGLGTRHEAGAAITAVTDAVAIVLSQSTQTISIFNSGRLMTEIEQGHSGGSDS